MADDTKKVSLRDMGPGPSTGYIAGPLYRDIGVESLKIARVPVSLKAVTLEGIYDPELRGNITKYISKIFNLLKVPVGLRLSGPSASGKSAIAAMVAMETLRWCKTVLWMTHEDMQRLQHDPREARAGDGQLVAQIVKSADLLILDGFNEDFVYDKTYDAVKLEKLIQARNGDCKATILTSRIAPEDFKKTMPNLLSVASRTMHGFLVKPPPDGYRSSLLDLIKE